MNRDCFWLTEDQYSRLAPLLPSDTRGKPRVDDRRVISGIVHVLKSGGRWIDAPDVYGPHKTLYNRFVRWAAKGVWVDIFDILASAGGPPTQVLIDSSAYDSNAIRRQIEGKGAMPNIPPKANRRWKNCFSPLLYRNRNAIERMFGRLKDFRRIATRYDRLADNFLAAVCLAATVSYWL